MISKEDMNALSAFEDAFKTALENDYYRGMTSGVLNKLNDIFERITGSRHKGSWGCPHCTMRFIKMLANMYFDEKVRLLKNPDSPKETRTQTVTDSESKRKPGRPRRVATNKE